MRPHQKVINDAPALAARSRETLVGKEAITLTELAPRGPVLVDSEEWTAEPDERVRTQRGSRW